MRRTDQKWFCKSSKHIFTLFSVFILFWSQTGMAQDYPVQLSTANRDIYNVPVRSWSVVQAMDSNDTGFEVIQKLPERYEVENVFQISLKVYQDSSLVDSYITLCKVKDSSGTAYFIFDSNNDEDLRNDPVISFQTRLRYFAEYELTRKDTIVDGPVIVDYENGGELYRDFRTLRLTDIDPAAGILGYSSALGKFGQLAIDGKTYPIGIFNDGELEYSEYDDLWIDLNRNGTFDRTSDFFRQMYLPLTIGQKAYKVSEVDQFGRSLTLEAFEPDSVPPVAVGLPAPDFQAVTVDSTQFHLSDYFGKYIVLDFWACNGPFGISRFYDIYEEFKENDRVVFVSSGPYEPGQPILDDRDIRITWPHIYGWAEVPARILYQSDGLYNTFIIDPSGNIVERLHHYPAEQIIKSLNAHLQESL